MEMTRITIAHRHETIAFAKRIVCLERGRIVEDVRVEENKPASNLGVGSSAM